MVFKVAEAERKSSEDGTHKLVFLVKNANYPLTSVFFVLRPIVVHFYKCAVAEIVQCFMQTNHTSCSGE